MLHLKLPWRHSVYEMKIFIFFNESTRKTCKNTKDVFLYVVWFQRHQHFKMPVKWHKKWFTWLSLKLYQKGGNISSSNSIHMKNFSAVVSPRLQAINAEQVYFQNTPNYSDASFICFQALCKLSYIFSSTFSWSCNIWFDILANWIAITSAQGDSSLQYDEYVLFPTNWWKHVESSVFSSMAFDREYLATQDWLWSLFQKSQWITWPLLQFACVPSKRRMEACLGVRHTNSMQFVTVEKLQKSPKSRNCTNLMQCFNFGARASLRWG